jgi:hypothetical protein
MKHSMNQRLNHSIHPAITRQTALKFNQNMNNYFSLFIFSRLMVKTNNDKILGFSWLFSFKSQWYNCTFLLHFYLLLFL